MDEPRPLPGNPVAIIARPAAVTIQAGWPESVRRYDERREEALLAALLGADHADTAIVVYALPE